MKYYTIFLLVIFYLYSCERKYKKTFEHAGGVFKMCLSDFPSTNFAREVTDVHSANVMYQIMEGLVSFNTDDLKVVPQIAESWKVSTDNLKYTFKIRNNIYFHECEVLKSKSSRKLTMVDVIHSFEIACKKDKQGNPSPAYTSFFKGTLKGVDKFHEGKSKSISGLVVKENYLIIELEKPDANFLNKLAHINASISSKKVYESKKENLMIGTGPFMYKGINESGDLPIIRLIKNSDYYMTDNDGNSLPYLDAVEFIIETKKLDELEMFENGVIHFIATLPMSRISEMLEGRIKDFNTVPPLLILRNNPQLVTNYYFFNMEDSRFKDKRVRQAFNYAINKNELIQNVLRGQAYENGIYGMIPPISNLFRSYDFKGIKEFSYDYNPEKARQLLADAGYLNGKGFGSVDLRINVGDVHSAVAEEISKDLYCVLGINVNIEASSFEIKNNDASKGIGDLFRSAWFADYVSPESFLINFYGKIVPESKNDYSIVNQSRYKNAKFDQLFESAKKQVKMSECLRIFAEAEKELMKDPPLIVLWYNVDIQLVYSKVRNFHDNPLNYYIFKNVYIKDWTKEEYENKVKKI
jgi:ABC-type transport system substrate-binding protein